ncbi:hypothetical protein HOF40_01105 [Candidatus Parcubacteria bacterium]|jgi:hypothetical protein|nr:hypothetical protein [Candidatus Parcubacteria bacterium]MBT3948667.1 hypothetical protein [Candidatus Parcubacteria bacterium]
MLPWIQKLSKFKKTATVLFFAVVAVFILVNTGFDTQVFAQDDAFGVVSVDEEILLSGTDIRIVIVKIIRAVLGLLGIITVSLIIYAGFLIMTSGGNEEKVAKGKKTMINAVVGLIVIFTAFAIVQFVINSLGGVGKPSQSRPPAMATFSGSGALGKIVKDHYPFRDDSGIPRNTSIVVTFGIPINPSSVAENINGTCWGADNLPTNVGCELDGGEIVNPYYGDCFDTSGDGLINWDSECDRLNTSSVKIGLLENIDTVNWSTDYDGGISSAVVMSYEGSGTAGQQEVYTLVFKPLDYLGSSTVEQLYTVHLRDSIMKKGSDTESVFAGQFGSPDYWWNFETGTGLDLKPPHVESVYPNEGHQVAKNTILQINFDEPVDPTVTQGYFSQNGSFQNILVNTEGTMVTGTWKITNGYKTVEFISDEPCGLNSCGDTMYCLPVDCTGESTDECTKEYNMLVRTAEWTHNADALFEAQPFSGVYDLAFNGLDNINDNAVNGVNETLNRPTEASGYTGKIINEGEGGPDNYWWNIRVKNEIDMSRPYVADTLPGVDAEDIDGEAKVEIGFNRVMWLSTLKSSISITEHPAHVCAQAAVGDVAPENVVCEDHERLDDIWFSVRANNTNDRTVSYIKHRTFGPNGLDLYYFPSIPSTVKGTNQNCLYPGYGPWQNSSADKDHPSTCEVSFDENGVVIESPGCVEVNMTSSTDTGCAYTGGSITGSNDVKIKKANVSECINTLSDPTISPTRYN